MLHRFLLAACFCALATTAHAQTMRCVASWYFEGVRTASGERFRPDGLTAASRTLPFGTRVRVTYGSRSVAVRINDRGPYVRGRCIDLSRGAARRIGLIGAGVGTVTITVIH